MKYQMAILVLAASISQSFTIQPAFADYYTHMNNLAHKAARQRADAAVDFAEGRYGKAAMHQRKAFKDDYRRGGYGYRYSQFGY